MSCSLVMQTRHLTRWSTDKIESRIYLSLMVTVLVRRCHDFDGKSQMIDAMHLNSKT